MENEKLIYRIKFEKTGAMKFIGHLDLLKIFQRAVKRSVLPVAYSQGFNPHQIMSFALPLSVGVESIGEIVDVEFTNILDCCDTIEKFNLTMPNGLKVVNVRRLTTGEKNAAASLSSASYELVFPETITKSGLRKAIDEILTESQIIITRTSKKGDKQVDVRPMIHELTLLEFPVAVNTLIDTGSASNLKADVIAEIICEKLGISYTPGDVRIKRLALFGENGSL
ncbi:MAG: TIGR03936 family radical SAM-associated protein [Defluviitaleaceae bacterium]|nr:TIGR03936 family radical SAM-associated protein [Defluviitaleaceae bacterium]